MCKKYVINLTNNRMEYILVPTAFHLKEGEVRRMGLVSWLVNNRFLLVVNPEEVRYQTSGQCHLNKTELVTRSGSQESDKARWQHEINLVLVHHFLL